MFRCNLVGVMREELGKIVVVDLLREGVCLRLLVNLSEGLIIRGSGEVTGVIKTSSSRHSSLSDTYANHLNSVSGHYAPRDQ